MFDYCHKRASDLILNTINFHHDSWGAPLPSISSPVAGGGNFSGAGYGAGFGAGFPHHFGSRLSCYKKRNKSMNNKIWCTATFCLAKSNSEKKSAIFLLVFYW